MPATRIDATYRVTTPMFCGGANGKDAELRLPSFKGVLRYWWRALAWSKYGGDLTKIAKEEDELFGSAGGRQSRVSMRLGSTPTTRTRTRRVDLGDGARYLGYGVMTGRLRDSLDGGFDFTVQMRLFGTHKMSIRPEQKTLLEDALMCVGVFGGLGAKSRKGYGSVAIRALAVGEEPRTIPKSMADLKQTITDLRREYASRSRPEYTALSQDARYLLMTSRKQEPLEFLDLLGRELMWFRSWGRGGTLFGKKSEKNFRCDHDLMKRVGEKKNHPKRIAFGLPHNYGKGREVVPHSPKLNRRASPLFIHIHECDEGPVAVLSFLPARFLPKGTRINVGGDPVPQSPEDKLYRPINRFFNRLLNNGEERTGQRREPFPFTKVVEVLS